MKGNVFFGWNSDNALAKAVSDALIKYDYNGIVGGNSGDGIDLTVSTTVVNQMRSSCSAIMLFGVKLLTQNNETLKILSSNMIYEAR